MIALSYQKDGRLKEAEVSSTIYKMGRLLAGAFPVFGLDLGPVPGPCFTFF